MKIVVHASRELAHPAAGGSEIYVDNVLNGLVELGHDVELIAGGPVGERSYRTTSSGGTFGQFVIAPLRLMTTRRDADLVIDVTNGMTFFSPLFRTKPSASLVHHVHTKMWSDWFSPPVAALGRFLETKAMPRAYSDSTIIAISESTKIELQRLGLNEENIRLVFNSTIVPEEPMAETDDRPLFVSCGRLVPHKQFHLLLENWPTVYEQTGGRLVIIGEGPERSRLEPMLTEGAELAGMVSQEERDELFARATALVHPAYVEGWGLVIMEAAAQRTPAIGLDVPGVRDSIVDGETGWVCHDEKHFVKQWISMVRDRESLVSMSAAAHSRAVDFGVGRQVADFAAVVEEAAKRQPSPRRSRWLSVLTGKQPQDSHAAPAAPMV